MNEKAKLSIGMKILRFIVRLPGRPNWLANIYFSRLIVLAMRAGREKRKGTK